MTLPIRATLPERDLDEAIGRDPALWEDFRGGSVFFTGGTGFIGSWMIATLRRASVRLDLGCRITLLTRNPEAPRLRELGLANARDVTLIRGDVRQPIGFSDPITHLVHAATDASAKINTEQPLTMLDTIVEGTRQVLDCVARTHPRRFLFLSSGAVYGRSPVGHVDEDCRLGPDPLAAGSAYAEGKRLAEQLCSIHGRQAGAPQITIARCFAFVGPLLPLDAHFAIGNFIRDGLAGREITISGDGTAVRSYLHAGDLSAWLWRIMVHGQHLRPYNVGSDEGFDMRAIATLVARRLTPQPEVAVRGAPTGAPPDIYLPSTARARKELGLHTWTPLTEAIDRTLAWHRVLGG